MILKILEIQTVPLKIAPKIWELFLWQQLVYIKAQKDKKKTKYKSPFTPLFTFEMQIEQNDVMCSTCTIYILTGYEGNRLSLWSLKMDTLDQAIAQVV